MKSGELLPVPVVLALLRITRNQPEKPEDEWALFDAFGCFDRTHAFQRAVKAQLGVNMGSGHKIDVLRGQLDTVLVEMLREHHEAREAQRDAA